MVSTSYLGLDGRDSDVISEEPWPLSQATSTSSSGVVWVCVGGGHWGVPRPDERFNLFNVSLVNPGISYIYIYTYAALFCNKYGMSNWIHIFIPKFETESRFLSKATNESRITTTQTFFFFRDVSKELIKHLKKDYTTLEFFLVLPYWLILHI